MGSAELLLRRRNLDAFIRADPVTITFSRPTQVNTGNGGWKPGTPTVLPPQQMRFVPFKRRLSDEIVNTQDGYQMYGEYVLVGRPNIDAEKGDEFDHNGLHYRVKDIEPKSDDRAQSDRVSLLLEVRG